MKAVLVSLITFISLLSCGISENDKETNIHNELLSEQDSASVEVFTENSFPHDSVSEILLPINNKDIERYYTIDEYGQYKLNKESLLSAKKFTVEENNILVKENEFGYKTNVGEYYPVGKFQNSEFYSIIILYFVPGENDRTIFNVQLNTYRPNGEITDALLLDQRFVFENEYYHEFEISSNRRISIKKFKIEKLIVNEAGDIIGTKTKPDTTVINIKYQLNEKGYYY